MKNKNKNKKKKEIIIFDAKRDNNERGISAKKLIKLLDNVEK